MHREESPSPPPLPSTLPPVYQTTHSVGITTNNNNNIVRGFAKMGMEEEDDKKPKPGESGVSIWLRFFDETIKIIKHKGIKIQIISNSLSL